MPILKSGMNPIKAGGGGKQKPAAVQSAGNVIQQAISASQKTPVNTTQLNPAVLAGAVKDQVVAEPAPTPGNGYGGGGGGGSSSGGGGAAPTTNPLDSPAYMTYVNELMRQRQAAEATRERDTSQADQYYGTQVTRTNEEAGRGRTQIDNAFAGRNLTRSGARLDAQQEYGSAVDRQIADLMLAQQERRNALAQAYLSTVNELRRQQAQYALQYGIPLDPNNPNAQLIPV